MDWNKIYHLAKRNHRACYLKLLSHFHQIEIKTIVEIGVFRGKNAAVLREMFPEAHLFLVDPWKLSPEYLESGSAVSADPEIYKKALRRVEKLFEHDPKTTLLKKSSQEALSAVPSLIDLVFIDANHAYTFVKQDILSWEKKVRPGGILSGHNYGRKRLPGVKKAVDECLKGSFFLGQDEVWAYIKKCPAPERSRTNFSRE